MTITSDKATNTVASADIESSASSSLYTEYMNSLKELDPLKAIYLFDGSETIFKVLNDLGYIDTLSSTDSVAVRYIPKRNLLVPRIMFRGSMLNGSESDDERLAEDARCDVVFSDILHKTGWDAKISDMLNDIAKSAEGIEVQCTVSV